jgi:iron complex transport system substrate-binding protein
MVKLLGLFLACATFMIAGGCGRETSPAAPKSGPLRIVSLAPSVTETLFALGAVDEVVGVSQYCDFPPAVKKLPRVGSFITPEIEAIVALRPSLVIGLATASDLREIKALHAIGIASLMVDDSSIAAIEQSVIAVGDHTGRGAIARKVIAALRHKMFLIRQRLRDQPQPAVLMVVGHQPLVAVGPETFLNELLMLAKSVNIAAPSDQAWPRLSLEYIIASRPQVILDGQMGTDPTMPDTFWAKYPTIPAVKNHRVLGYPEDPTLHPGPRIGLTLELLARRIHPEAFRSGTEPMVPN